MIDPEWGPRGPVRAMERSPSRNLKIPRLSNLKRSAVRAPKCRRKTSLVSESNGTVVPYGGPKFGPGAGSGTAGRGSIAEGSLRISADEFVVIPLLFQSVTGQFSNSRG